MKNIFLKFTILFCITSTLISCGDHEDVIFNPESGQTFISFEESGKLLSVSESDVENTNTIEIVLVSNTLSNNTRTLQISVVEDDSTADSNMYTIENAVIPANEFFGAITVKGNIENLTSQIKTVVLSLSEIDETGAVLTEDTFTLRLRKVN